jgi:hypothetical protein
MANPQSNITSLQIVTIFMKKFPVIILLAVLAFTACKKDKDQPAPKEPMLVFRFKFDPTQQRLDNLGNPSVVPPNHGALSPSFNKMSAHYIELSPNEFTPLGSGTVVFHHDETTAGGATAIDFSKSVLAGNNQTFFSIPLKNVAAGSYKYLRVSLAYQNYDIQMRVAGFDMTGTLASFIGYNTYINSFKIKDSTVMLNANRMQGYWALEIHDFGIPLTNYVVSGQAPEGATTVPNPVAATSPIPAGSCVVTGAFASPFVITGNETDDIIITVSLSTNNSFEWVEHSTTGIFEPTDGDTVVDMGIRGLIPLVAQQ